MDTIQTDVAAEPVVPAVETPAVETPEGDAQKERPVSDMDQARLDIYKRHTERQVEATPELALASGAPPSAVAAAPEPTQDPEPASDPDELVPLKVNGQTLYRPRSDVDAAGGIAAIQKQISGDMKLAEAAQERKRLEQERAEIARQRAELDAERAKKAQQQVDIDIEAEAKALSEGILLGDEEKLNEAMRLVLKVAKAPAQAAPAAPQINTDEIATQAAKKARYDLELETGRTEFEEKYRDIATDPTLRAQANQLTVILQQQYPTWTPRRIILEAARLTRLENAKAAPQVVVDPLEQKNLRKAGAAASIPHVAARAQGTPTPQPKTKSQVFEQLSSYRHR